jgi:hypothetical protein
MARYFYADGSKAPLDINAQTGTTYTTVLADQVVTMNNASANTLTIPPNSSVAYELGTTLAVFQIGAGQTTIAAGAGVTINKSVGLLITAQQDACSLLKTGTDTWQLVGNMSA